VARRSLWRIAASKLGRAAMMVMGAGPGLEGSGLVGLGQRRFSPGGGMTSVRYIKLHKAEKARHLCELAEEYIQAGKRVLITVLDDNQGVTLDRFLWTWKRGSFIPHAYDNGAVDCLDEPVVIGTCERNPNGARVLVMGKPCSVAFARLFDEVIDFAELYDETLAEESRRRYAEFRAAGFDLAVR